MWKVRRAEDRGRIVLKLIGWLEGAQLTELDAFESVAADHGLILDLADVRLVDQDAVRFLADWETRGAQVQNCPPYIREWIDAEKSIREPAINQE
jgi:ABC-type transporter Mla MlaB component